MDELGIRAEEKSDETSDWILTSKQENKVEVLNRRIINSLVPDVSGMGAKDAVFVLEKAGLRVVINGYGKVTKQSIMPGSKVDMNETIVINMSSS